MKLTAGRIRRIAALPPKSEYGPRELHARDLYESGLTYKQIAEQVGLSTARVGEMVTDPRRLGAKRRKAQHNGECINCGGETTADGPNNVPTRCARCSRRHIHESRKWTPETIVDAIRRWADECGSPPTSVDWNVAHWGRNKDAAELFRRGDFPATNTVVDEFGRWRDAIIAAGFSPRASSTPDEFPAKCAEARRMYEQGIAVTNIAWTMGVSLTAAQYRLGAAGVEKYVPMYEKSYAGTRAANERRSAA